MDKARMREVIAKRVSQELQDGDVVNLGIGLPTMVANYVPSDIDIIINYNLIFGGFNYILNEIPDEFLKMQ